MPVIGREPRAVENGRRNVDGRAERTGACRVRRLRLGPDERHAHDALVLLGALEQQTVIAEMVAVVGGEDRHGVVGLAAIAQRRQHAADGVVDAGDHAAGQRMGFLRFARRGADRAHAIEIGRALRPRVDHRLHMRRRRPVVAGERFRHGELLRPVHVPVFAGRIERMVRVGKRHHEEERLIVTRMRAEIRGGALADIGGRIKRGGNARAVRLRADIVVRQRVLRPEQAQRLQARARAASACSRR